ncbi:LOW QUALITY PROTEIN: hypothetical protein EUGRSUZ_B03966 [Eucalyptus grandis]|uniref:Uncharacterized protein n=1 Tax=Eucalyptus grandis TaxID=71139 RepID=A0ACC3LXZ3_EUCGR|nr:LOW QUALITY PROTEIN: hypothetical protein EUGRSUZ_B03966 [Eucalyptus grandis]
MLPPLPPRLRGALSSSPCHSPPTPPSPPLSLRTSPELPSPPFALRPPRLGPFPPTTPTSAPSNAPTPSPASSTLRAKFAIPFDKHAFSSEDVSSVDELACVLQLHKRFELWTIQSMYLWNSAMRKLRDLGNSDVVPRLASETGYRVHRIGHGRRVAFIGS